MDLHLKPEEASLVLRVLRSRLNDLRTEVRHDKDSEVRNYLKHKERILSGVLEKFPEPDEEAHRKIG